MDRGEKYCEAGIKPTPPSSVATDTASRPRMLRPATAGFFHRTRCTISPPMTSAASGAQGRKTDRSSYCRVDSRNISKNGSAAAKISRQNTSIQAHSTASATVEGITFCVSMDTAVTASIRAK